MPTDFRISDLPTSIPFNNLDLMEVSQVDSESPSGYSSVKKTIEEIGEKINNDIQYASALATTNKNIIPAINELLAAIADVADDIPDNSDFSLSGLSDTTITNPTSGEILSYNGNKWVNIGVEDVTNQITWNETTVATGTKALKVNNMLFLTYMGENKTHAANDTIIVMPSGLRPISVGWRVAFAVNGLTYGNLVFASNGNVNINQINDDTQSGRIYFSVAYPIA